VESPQDVQFCSEVGSVSHRTALGSKSIALGDCAWQSRRLDVEATGRGSTPAPIQRSGQGDRADGACIVSTTDQKS